MAVVVNNAQCVEYCEKHCKDKEFPFQIVFLIVSEEVSENQSEVTQIKRNALLG